MLEHFASESPWWAERSDRAVTDQVADALRLHAAAKALLHRHSEVGDEGAGAQVELVATAFAAHCASLVGTFMTA